MLVSELINKLQKVQKEHGDLDVLMGIWEDDIAQKVCVVTADEYKYVRIVDDETIASEMEYEEGEENFTIKEVV